MATASPAAPNTLKPGVAPLRAGQGTSFLLRRLHSLTGIIPVGAFLFEHLLISNAAAIGGPTAYARQVRFLASLPLVPALELFGIWLPILFHALYGFYIWFRGESNITDYPWAGNWMFTAQRWTGGVAFSPDKAQKYLYISDLTNNHVWFLNRAAAARGEGRRKPGRSLPSR